LFSPKCPVLQPAVLWCMLSRLGSVPLVVLVWMVAGREWVVRG
jgi:hypothetical protein